MSFARVGVVTGANKGIGYAIIRQLALQYPKSPLNNRPLLIYLTARDVKHGKSTITSLTDDPARDSFDLNIVKTTLSINYHSTLEATHAFLPLLKKPSSRRLVNVASSARQLNHYSHAIQKHFQSTTSVDNITALIDEFTTTAGNTRATLQIAKELKRQHNNKVLVNACCPRWVVTDMTKGKGHKTPDQEAQTPVMLAIGDFGGKSGRFWRDKREISWSG
ncbi:carbonyl reductase [Lasiosphaeria hispida]|uniref:Carbonyl reductase n=1 Tax=Lasiosphaeria hispida TaxID=260671 RepID=A0AAJ0HX30_9PEZI|nr:carbonyl reductase [Lasiosphaeria hispida]